MLWNAVRRCGAGISAAAVAVLAVSVGALPAAAQQAAGQLKMTVVDVKLSPEAAKTYYTVIESASAEPVTATNVEMVVDASGLAGVATAATDSGRCSTAGAVITCRDQSLTVGSGASGLRTNPVTYTAATGAEIGDTATFTVTLRADGMQPVTDTVTLTIVEGVNLADATGEPTLSAAPGQNVGLPLAVRNAGKTTVDGVRLFVTGDYPLTPSKRYSNCEYVGDAAICEFDTELDAETTYDLSEPMPFLLRADALGPGRTQKELLWATESDLGEFLNLDLWRSANPVRGTEPPLRLVPEAAGVAADQTDTDDLDNWGLVFVSVTGNNPADLAAVGAALAGEAGVTVEANVGVQNRGPATVDATRSGEPVARATVVIPPGTTVVSAPELCVPETGEGQFGQPGAPGGREYLCRAPDFLKVGNTFTWKFGLRIDQKIANAKGSLTLDPDYMVSGDASNNTAEIVVNGDNGGGGLPITGANVAWTAGAGVVLVLLGFAAYRLGRRRPHDAA